jgi:hypothetical protein
MIFFIVSKSCDQQFWKTLTPGVVSFCRASAASPGFFLTGLSLAKIKNPENLISSPVPKTTFCLRQKKHTFREIKISLKKNHEVSTIFLPEAKSFFFSWPPAKKLYSLHDFFFISCPKLRPAMTNPYIRGFFISSRVFFFRFISDKNK